MSTVASGLPFNVTEDRHIRAEKRERRDRIATAILAAFATGGAAAAEGRGETTIAYCAERAVVWADALIAELNK